MAASAPLCARSLYAIFFSILYSSKSCFWVFQRARCHWAATKAKDSWLLGPDEVHSLITRQQKTFDAFFVWPGELTRPQRNAGWEGWKRDEGGRERGRGEEGKGCRSFNHVCLTALCGGTEEKREGGMEGSRERERVRERERERGEKRESLKHCLYAGKFWTTLLTSKCFH